MLSPANELQVEHFKEERSAMSNQQQNINAQHAHMRPTLSSQNPYSVPVPVYSASYTPPPSTPYYTPTQTSTMTMGVPTHVQAAMPPAISSWRRIFHLPVAILRMFFRPTLATFRREIQWAHWGMTWLLLISVIAIPAFIEIIIILFYPPIYSRDYDDYSVVIFFIGFMLELALFFFYTLIQYISSGDVQTGNPAPNGVEKDKRYKALCYSIICIALPLGLIFTTLVTADMSGFFRIYGYYDERMAIIWTGLVASAILGLYGLFLNIQAFRAIYGFGWLRATIVTLTPLVSAFILVGGYNIVWYLIGNN